MNIESRLSFCFDNDIARKPWIQFHGTFYHVTTWGNGGQEIFGKRWQSVLWLFFIAMIKERRTTPRVRFFCVRLTWFGLNRWEERGREPEVMKSPEVRSQRSEDSKDQRSDVGDQRSDVRIRKEDFLNRHSLLVKQKHFSPISQLSVVDRIALKV